MSFILDALKRADQERRQEPLIVNFDSSAELHEETPQQRNKRLIFGAGIVLLLVLALVAYFGLQARQDSQMPTRDSSLATTNSPVEAPAPDPKASTNTATATVKELPQETNVARNEAPAAAANTSPAQPTEPPAPEAVNEIDRLYVAEQPPVIADRAVEQLYREPEPQQPVARAEQAIRDQAAAVAPVPEPVVPAMTQIRDLPWSLQQKIPSISYSSHHYDENGQSYVVINGTQRRAGQQLEQNLRLDEVLADGVVLSYEGRQFKLPALSSWVNM